MITYTDYDTFLKDVQREIEFMERHNPSDELEIIAGTRVCFNLKHECMRYLKLSPFKAHTLYGIPFKIDFTLPPDKADVVLKK